MKTRKALGRIGVELNAAQREHWAKIFQDQIDELIPDAARLDFWIENSRYANQSIRLSRVWPEGKAEAWRVIIQNTKGETKYSDNAPTPREAIDNALKGAAVHGPLASVDSPQPKTNGE